MYGEYFVVKMTERCYWEIILHRPLHYLKVFQAVTLTTFVPDYCCQDICIPSNLGRQKQCLLLEEMAGLLIIQYNKEMSTSGFKVRQVSLLSILRDLYSLTLGFFSYSKSYVKYVQHIQSIVILLLLIILFYLLKILIYFSSANFWCSFHAIQSGYPVSSSSFWSFLTPSSSLSLPTFSPKRVRFSSFILPQHSVLCIF